MKTIIHNVALAINNAIMRKGIAYYINSFGEYKITFEAKNQNELLAEISKSLISPDFCILNLNYNITDYSEATITQIKQGYPLTKIVAFIMPHDQEGILRMLHVGTHSLLSFDCSPGDLKNALHVLKNKNFYYPDFVIDTIHETPNFDRPELSEKELKFITLCCSELTYKEIADKMLVSIRVIETIREHLFKKFDTVSKTGLVLKALRCKIISI